MKTVPSENILNITLRSIGDAVISCDRDGRILLMNAVAEQLTLWAESEAVGQMLADVFVIVNEFTRLPVESPVAKVFRHGNVVGLAKHTLLLRRDGTEIAIDDSASPVVHPETGEMRGVVLVFRDVTERRRAEWTLELLAESGRVMDGTRRPAAILADIGEIVSRHFTDVSLFDLEEPTGEMVRIVGRHRNSNMQPMADALQAFPVRRQDSRHPTHSALATGRSVLLNGITDSIMRAAASSDAHYAFFRDRLKPRSVMAVPIRAGKDNLGVMTFIRHLRTEPFSENDRMVAEELGTRLGTALKLARLQSELQEQADRLDAIIQSVPVGIVMSDAAGKIVFSNRASEQIFRHPAIPSENFDEHAAWVAFHPDGRRVQGTEFPLARAIQSELPVLEEEFLYQRGDGTRAWVTLAAAPIHDSRGNVNGGVVVVNDIDERKRSKEALQRSETRFRMLIEKSSVGFGIGNARGEFSYLNPALLHLLGYTAEEVDAGTVRWDRMTPMRYAPQDGRALEQLNATGVAVPYEKAYCAKDGREIPFLIGALVIPGATDEESEPEIALFATDLSMQKRAEAALLQTEKLAAVGKLASSISHEINNPLEAVTNLLFIARQDVGLSKATLDLLDSADRELYRVSQVTSQTLRFHRQSTAATTIHPESLVEEVFRLYAARIANAHIELWPDFGRDVVVTCYEGDIRQVLSNLIGNAVDVMKLGGVLTVRTRRATRWSTGQAGVCITIADNGAGMSAETRARIFDAFFTTKGINGTGLGLWISCRIVHKHRGYVRAWSSTAAAHHGTVFQLWLPAELADTAREAWHVEDEKPR